MNKRNNYLITGIGLVLLVIGLLWTKRLVGSNTIATTLPYLAIGFGCIIFGYGMGNIVTKKTLQAYPEVERQMAIEKNDERNIAIANRAKSKAFDIMTYIFGALIVSFVFMGTDLVATLLLVFAYLFVEGYGIYYRNKYEHEM